MAMFFILRKWKVFIFLLLVVCMLTMLLYVVLEHYNPDVRRTPVSGSKASHDGDPIFRFATDHKDIRGFITVEPEKKEPQLSTETTASLTDNSSVIEREHERERQDHSLPEERAPDKSVIEGPTVSSVADAKRRVEIISWTNRSREKPTHFISIPLNRPNIMENFNSFKEIVLSICGKDSDIYPELFQVPAKLHLTLGVMRIFSAAEEERAKEVLRESITKAVHCLGTDPAVISLRGLASMKDDPSAEDALYAKVSLTDQSNRLQQFVDTVVSHIIKEAPELMEWEFEREGVKLHMTVMNSDFSKRQAAEKDGSWRSGPSQDSGRSKRPLTYSFDSRVFVGELKDFEFGEATFEKVHLSKMGDYGPDGYYRCIHEYPINEFCTSTCT